MDSETGEAMFKLALPWIFIILPLPILLWFLCPRVPLQLPAALRIPFFNAIAQRLDNNQYISHKPTQLAVLSFIWILLVFALAGPIWVGEPQASKREGHNIMLALDLSGSMQLDDMMLRGRRASRLSVVKLAASQFVHDRPGEKIGLILFGSLAYLQTPLTYDHHSVLQRIEDATVGLAGQTTSIGDALGLAVKRLQEVPTKGRVIILLTDGVNNSGVLAPLKAAELAAAKGIKIYTIGLGASPDPKLAGNLFLSLNVTADLDEDTLKEVAKLTGGRYFRATDSQSLHAVYQKINQMETVSQQQQALRPQHEMYAWPLAVAFFLFCYWLFQQMDVVPFRRRHVEGKEHAL